MFVTAYFIYWLLWQAYWRVRNYCLHSAVEAEKHRRQAKLRGPLSNTVFTGESADDRFLKMDVPQLREQMDAGYVTSLQLVHMFGKRCQGIGMDCLLITEENFTEALELAKACDLQTE